MEKRLYFRGLYGGTARRGGNILAVLPVPDEIDGARAEESRIRALDRLHLAENIKEHRHNEISLARAMARLKVKNKL